MSNIVKNLASVLSKIQQQQQQAHLKAVSRGILVAHSRSSSQIEQTHSNSLLDNNVLQQSTTRSQSVRLVAVSKTKPIEDIVEAYNAGQRHFGENYVQELVEKAHSDVIRTQCPDIRWHFIGNLQSNKAKKIACLPNIFLVETVDSTKLADLLNTHYGNLVAADKPPRLNIMIQVNTSDEAQKGGITTNEVVEVYRHIKDKCEHLNIFGLMTIGSYEQSTSGTDTNVDFENLVKCKRELIDAFQLSEDQLELSMGMSHDYELAIRMGSNNVRVGSLIFGSRS